MRTPSRHLTMHNDLVNIYMYVYRLINMYMHNEGQIDGQMNKLVLPWYTIPQITIYNFTNHDIQFHISWYITCRDIQCAHLSDNNVSSLKAIMRKIQEKNISCWVRTVNLQKKKHTGFELLTFTFKDIHLTVCTICTNIQKSRISLDFILKWPNCHIDRLCFLCRIVLQILISRYIDISWQHKNKQTDRRPDR